MILCTSSGAQEAQRTRPAVATDPIDGIVAAFNSHDVVALAEGAGHGHEQGHAFLVSLLADGRVVGVVDDIVVEWGNSLYQDVIDRYTGGQDVLYSDLRQVWENTTQPHTVWDSPVFAAFFEAVRAVNEALPEDRHYRVLLGDPPVDWDEVSSPRDLAVFSRERDAYPAELIRSEVVENGRRALVVYGGLHLTRLPRQQNAPAPEDPDLRYVSQTLVMRLEQMGIDVFNVFGVSIDAAEEIQSTASDWDPVTMTLIEGTVLGIAGFQEYFPSTDATPMHDQFDALMIYGPRSSMTFSELPSELCQDDRYIEMRAGRMRMNDSEEFRRRYCGAVDSD